MGGTYSRLREYQPPFNLTKEDLIEKYFPDDNLNQIMQILNTLANYVIANELKFRNHIDINDWIVFRLIELERLTNRFFQDDLNLGIFYKDFREAYGMPPIKVLDRDPGDIENEYDL